MVERLVLNVFDATGEKEYEKGYSRFGVMCGV